jgi:hypothetical protein
LVIRELNSKGYNAELGEPITVQLEAGAGHFLNYRFDYWLTCEPKEIYKVAEPVLKSSDLGQYDAILFVYFLAIQHAFSYGKNREYSIPIPFGSLIRPSPAGAPGNWENTYRALPDIGRLMVGHFLWSPKLGRPLIKKNNRDIDKQTRLVQYTSIKSTHYGFFNRVTETTGSWRWAESEGAFYTRIVRDLLENVPGAGMGNEPR